jgi:thiamine-phosphate pyrophosphorylase
MIRRHPAPNVIWPRIWLVTDARNDTALEAALAWLPRGSGMIFRHYHLAPAARRARFGKLARLVRRRGHLVILSGSGALARQWGADGAYGSPRQLARGPACLRLVTAHSLREIGEARRARADAIVLSPVFATRSHPEARPLGNLRFRLLTRRAGRPVVALGGMNAARWWWTGCAAWAAIDGICDKATRSISLDS